MEIDYKNLPRKIKKGLKRSIQKNHPNQKLKNIEVYRVLKFRLSNRYIIDTEIISLSNNKADFKNYIVFESGLKKWL